MEERANRLRLSRELSDVTLQRFRWNRESGSVYESLNLPFRVHSEPVNTRPALAGSDGDAELQALFREANAHCELYRLDPCLRQNLVHLGQGWRISDLPRLIIRNSRGIVAFDDSWTAVGWSDWWAHNHTIPNEDIVVIHLDDHQDMVHPLLLASEDGSRWEDPVTGHEVLFQQPESVAAAVMSGAIGIGCFFVPWLHTWPKFRILHLQRGIQHLEERWLTRSFCAEPRIRKAARRPSVTFEHSSSTKGPDIAHYLRSSDLSLLLTTITPEARVLLHIDLDYFNNSFAGGRTLVRTEPNEEKMIREIEEVCRELKRNGVERRIEHVSIALSPGFCPSRYWPSLLVTLRHELRDIGCACPF